MREGVLPTLQSVSGRLRSQCRAEIRELDDFAAREALERIDAPSGRDQRGLRQRASRATWRGKIPARIGGSDAIVSFSVSALPWRVEARLEPS